MKPDLSPTEGLIEWLTQWGKEGSLPLAYSDQQIVVDFIRKGADLNNPSFIKILSSKTNFLLGFLDLILEYEAEGKGEIRSENGSNFFHFEAEQFPWKLGVFLNYSHRQDAAVICKWLNETRHIDKATPLLASAKTLIRSLSDKNPYKDEKYATHLINFASEMVNRGFFISHQDSDGMSITDYLYEAMRLGIKTDIEEDTKEKLCFLLASSEKQKLDNNTASVSNGTKKSLRL